MSAEIVTQEQELQTQTQAPAETMTADDLFDYCDALAGLLQQYKGKPEEPRLIVNYEQSLSDWIHARKREQEREREGQAQC